jgi:ABC-2 type transport system permease protein
MIRLILRGWYVQAYLDLMQLLRDRKTLFTYAFSELVLALAGVSGMILLATKFDGIGIWSRADIFFLLGYALTIDSIQEFFFGYNIRHISRRIGRGQLDHLLIQPRPLWIALFTEGFGPVSCLLRSIPGIWLIWWAAAHKPIGVSASWLFWLVLNLIGSTAAVMGFTFILGSLAFRSPREAEEISSPLQDMFVRLSVFPLDGLGLLSWGLLTALPVGLTAWFPARSLLFSAHSVAALVATPLAGIILMSFGIGLFVGGMAFYRQTGSQRYVDYGHRR